MYATAAEGEEGGEQAEAGGEVEQQEEYKSLGRTKEVAKMSESIYSK